MPFTTIYDGGTRVIGDTTITGIVPQSIHPNVFAYIAAQNSVGYAMTRVEVDAVNNLVWGMVGSGLWDKMQVVYPCIGNNAASFKWNLKDTTTFNITFLGSWVFAPTGMQVAAANYNNRGATGYIPNTHQTLGSAHISIYVRNFYTGGLTGPIFGGYSTFSGLGTVIGISQTLVGSADGWTQNAGSTSGRFSFSGFSGGMLTVSRIASSSFGVNTINGRFGANLGAYAASRYTAELTIGSAAFNGTTACQPQEIAFASLGLGLSLVDIRNFYIIVQAFQTKLGRQV